MRQVLIATISMMVMAGLILAADVPNIAPATNVQQVATVAPVPRVEVFAFTQIGDAAKADWIGRGIQENLQSDVSHSGAMLMIVSPPPDATADPVAVAKKNGATLAVLGTYQMVDDQVRVNGHMIDVASNTVVGSFSATGQQKDLFKVEDALGEQLRRLLPLPASNAVTTAQPTTPPPADNTPTVTYSQAPQAVTNYYEAAPAPTPYYYPDSFYYGTDYPLYLGFYGPGYFPGYYRGFAPFHGNSGFRGGDFHGGGGFHFGGGGHFGGGFHGGGGGGRR